MQWPHERGPAKYEAALIPTFCKIINGLQPYEPVDLIVSDEEAKLSAGEALKEAGVPQRHVTFRKIPTDNAWCRDNGPMFALADDGLRIIDWGFDGWAKYDYANDNKVPAAVAAGLHIEPIDRNDVIVEGGALEFNGDGVLIASGPCLDARNPSLEREEIERRLMETLCLDQVIWLERYPSDDTLTLGHTDGICRFIDAETVVVGRISDTSDKDRLVYEDAAERIERAEGACLRVERMRVPVEWQKNGQFNRYNYLNWYVANGVVLVGTFGVDECDEAAKATIQGYWPDREVIGIDVRELWWKGGGIHCVTQQQPAWPGSARG